MDEEEQTYVLTPKGIMVACLTHKMYLDGMSIEEISEHSGIPTDALQWLYAFANQVGVIDEFEENLKNESF